MHPGWFDDEGGNVIEKAGILTEVREASRCQLQGDRNLIPTSTRNQTANDLNGLGSRFSLRASRKKNTALFGKDEARIGLNLVKHRAEKQPGMEVGPTD